MSLLAFVHAWDSEATCTVGEQCSSDETGMLQKNARMAQVNEFSKANQTDGKYQKGAINVSMQGPTDASEPMQSICRCKEPNGNDNGIECHHEWYETVTNGERKHRIGLAFDDGNCPSCCQCTSATRFPSKDRANFCHGGDQCGKC